MKLNSIIRTVVAAILIHTNQIQTDEEHRSLFELNFVTYPTLWRRRPVKRSRKEFGDPDKDQGPNSWGQLFTWIWRNCRAPLFSILLGVYALPPLGGNTKRTQCPSESLRSNLRAYLSDSEESSKRSALYVLYVLYVLLAFLTSRKPLIA